MVYTFLGWGIVPHGGRALVVGPSGHPSVVDGPCRLFLFRTDFTLLRKYAATDEQYLKVVHEDGSAEHLCGPSTCFFNPLLHKSVTVLKKVTVDAGQSVVVYRTDAESAPPTAARVVVPGPQRYTPEAGAWLHKFSWSVPQQTADLKFESLAFFKLRTVPDQLLVPVGGARTKDDALLTLKFMVFYHLQDIHKMLESTHDPCGDVHSTLTADTMDFVGKRSFEEFKADCELLNSLETFPQLGARMVACGYNLTKVAYRGYDASKALQDMHNSAIEKRTGLKLEYETEQQTQELEDMKQTRRNERTLKDQQLQQQTQVHEEETKRKQVVEEIERARLQFQASQERAEASHQAEMKQAAEAASSTLEKERGSLELDLERRQRLDGLQVATLSALHEKVGLDATQYLVAQSEKFDRKIQVSSAPSHGSAAPQEGGSGAVVHLHSKL